MELTVNGRKHSLNVDPARTLLSVLREDLALTGTRYGCGEGQCGACTVHIGDTAVRSCLRRVGEVKAPVTTVEGLAQGEALHPLQSAFLEAGAFQCGYCTSGMLMTASALLGRTPAPSDDEILRAMQGNICRCGMFRRIRSAIRTAASKKGARA